MIVAPPTASGSSAATRLRKTKNESRKRIGKASSSARAMSSETCSPTCSPASSPPPTRHPRDRAPAGPARGRARRSASVRKVADHVGGAAVLGDQRAVAAALVAGRRSPSRGPGTPPRRGRASPAPARESAGAPRRTSATMSGDALAPVARSTSRARPAPPRPAGRRSRRRSRAARTPGRRRSRRRARRRASPTGSAGAGGRSGRRGGRASSAACRLRRVLEHLLRLDPAGRPLLARREHLEVERGDHVQQHPVGEERPQLGRLGARRLARPGARGRRSARAPAPGSRGPREAA